MSVCLCCGPQVTCHAALLGCNWSSPRTNTVKLPEHHLYTRTQKQTYKWGTVLRSSNSEHLWTEEGVSSTPRAARQDMSGANESVCLCVCVRVCVCDDQSVAGSSLFDRQRQIKRAREREGLTQRPGDYRQNRTQMLRGLGFLLRPTPHPPPQPPLPLPCICSCWLQPPSIMH